MSNKHLPGPCSVRQHMYMFPEEYAKDWDGNDIDIDHIDVVLYGGAAGSGKSEIGVIDFLKHTDTPNFIGIMTRRTTPQLQGPGGLLSKCKRIFSQVYDPDEYTWRAKDGKFVFHKSGAEIYLKHFENDDADVNWQGSEANLFYVDEGEQFTQHMVQYMMSRMRNPSCPDVQPHLRITTNPNGKHFLRKWVEPYLLPDGTPNRERDGRIRYFSFMAGDFVWADTKEELFQNHGIDEGDALSFTFISANVFDNQVIQKVNPKYVSWLKGLKGVERARLLEGSWYAIEEGASYFKRSWVEEVHDINYDEVEHSMIGLDFAGTLPSSLNPSPDWTAAVLMHRMRNGDYIISSILRRRIRHGDWEKFVVDFWGEAPPGTTVIIPQDPGIAAARATQLFCRRLAELGIPTKKEKTNRSKLDRFRPFASMAQNGGIRILSGCANDPDNKVTRDNDFYYTELENFTGERKRGELFHDDQVDATSTAFTALASKTTSLSGINRGLAEMGSQLVTGNPFK